jgi:hypothetical protein
MRRRIRRSWGIFDAAASSACSICYNAISVTTTQETTMDLPIKFPSETEVILEDVARLRALTPSERVQSLVGLLKAGDRIRQVSPKADWAAQYAEEQEVLAQHRIREFLTRHGY